MLTVERDIDSDQRSGCPNARAVLDLPLLRKPFELDTLVDVVANVLHLDAPTRH